MKFAALFFVAFAGTLSADGFTEYRVREDKHLRYRLFTPKVETENYRLLVFLPGGDGSDTFTPWVENIYQNAIPDDFMAVQLIAPKWTEEQQVVWPTRKTPAEKMGEPDKRIRSPHSKVLRKEKQLWKRMAHL